MRDDTPGTDPRTVERGLSWSRKWHIINPGRTDDRDHYAISKCGNYVFRNDDPKYPEALKSIRDGELKDTGLCRLCAKFAKIPVPAEPDVRQRVIDLAKRWETATELGTGKPSIVAQAFAAELRKAIEGGS